MRVLRHCNKYRSKAAWREDMFIFRDSGKKVSKAGEQIFVISPIRTCNPIVMSCFPPPIKSPLTYPCLVHSCLVFSLTVMIENFQVKYTRILAIAGRRPSCWWCEGRWHLQRLISKNSKENKWLELCLLAPQLASSAHRQFKAQPLQWCWPCSVGWFLLHQLTVKTTP